MAQAKDGRKPDAFLSYARLDDQVSDGYVSWLRDCLEGHVNAEIGKGTFWIFQDTDEIRAGEHWASALDDALAGARFLIPILSPSYFASQPCLFELAKFHGFESAAGRKDLIIPIYFRDAAEFLDDPANPHAALLKERQFFDWRKLRHKRRDDPEVMESVERLARDIKTALRRTASLAQAAGTSVQVITPPEALATLRQELAETRTARDSLASEAQQLRARLATAEQQRAALEPQLTTEAVRARDLEAKLAAALKETAEGRSKPGGVPPPNTGRRVPPAVWLVAMVAATGLSAVVTYAWTKDQAAALASRIADLQGQLATLSSESVDAAAAKGRVNELEAQIADLRTKQAPAPAAGSNPDRRPGEVFRDTLAGGSPCPFCPELVVIPAGSFVMGSPEGEAGRFSGEGPQHRVTIAKPFAIGRYEVTFAEWDACVADGGCKAYRPDDRGWGCGRMPVINVSWNDAQAYVDWLSRKTGQAYRLPSEAEWEHAARAGTSTPYWWGNEAGTGRANCYGCGSRWDNKQTAPVGSFAANPWGLFDTAGNVWEWVEDCWHDSYAGAPMDGSPWTGQCSGGYRVVRGGSWLSVPRLLRSAYRFWFVPEDRIYIQGFRVSRTLTP